MANMHDLLHHQYKVIAPLGKGGMSNVYLVEDVILHKYWALKELHPVSSLSTLSEVAILKRLDHPSLPRVVAIFEENGLDYVVMDYIEGISLDQVEKPDEMTLRDWMSQLATILDYLHHEKIIYRDLKPSNIILKPNGQLTLIDFGIAISQGQATTTALGTEGFAPPEQRQGECVFQSDLYALGMTIYFLGTQDVLENAHALKQYPGLSQELSQIIHRCIHPYVTKRYPDAKALLKALQRPKRRRLNFPYYGWLLLGLWCMGSAYYLDTFTYQHLVMQGKYSQAIKLNAQKSLAYESQLDQLRRNDVTSEELDHMSEMLIENEVNDALYEMMGKIILAYSPETLSKRMVKARRCFTLCQQPSDFLTLCEFMVSQDPLKEPCKEENEAMILWIEEHVGSHEAPFERLLFNYVSLLVLSDRSSALAKLQVDEHRLQTLYTILYEDALSIDSLVSELRDIQDKLKQFYPDMQLQLSTAYEQEAKYLQTRRHES